MRAEMLEHDYFDIEILYDGQKNPRKDEDKKQDKDLLDDKQVSEIIEQLKTEKIKEYSIMDIQPGVLNKVLKYKKLLFFVNLPFVVGIPLFVEFGLPEF